METTFDLTDTTRPYRLVGLVVLHAACGLAWLVGSFWIGLIFLHDTSSDLFGTLAVSVLAAGGLSWVAAATAMIARWNHGRPAGRVAGAWLLGAGAVSVAVAGIADLLVPDGVSFFA